MTASPRRITITATVILLVALWLLGWRGGSSTLPARTGEAITDLEIGIAPGNGGRTIVAVPTVPGPIERRPTDARSETTTSLDRGDGSGVVTQPGVDGTGDHAAPPLIDAVDVLGETIDRGTPNGQVGTSGPRSSGPGQGNGPGNGAGQGNGGPGQGSGPGNGAGQGGGDGAGQGPFRVDGTIDDLYPGAVMTLQLTVANPHAFAIDVLEITTAVGSPTSVGCAADHLTVEAWSGRTTIDRRSSGVVSVTVRLDHATPDECQGASWPLAFSGTAERTPR